ncbi:Cerato-platanin-domain-containing protein [Daedaleopsis nitida]|nr:Cerato-platanin-domain-containing protein [Daedaleopsis nitida]
MRRSLDKFSPRLSELTLWAYTLQNDGMYRPQTTAQARNMRPYPLRRLLLSLGRAHLKRSSFCGGLAPRPRHSLAPSTAGPTPASRLCLSSAQPIAMKLSATTIVAALVVALPHVTTAQTVQTTVTYSEVYDNPNIPVMDSACGGGDTGLVSDGFDTFGELPHFPSIGGAFVVTGQGSSGCGTCWELSRNGKSIRVLAIDTAGSGFNIARGAMDMLTNNQAIQLGRVGVTATRVDVGECGVDENKLKKPGN